MQLDEFLSILERATGYIPKRYLDEYSARCPCKDHDDKNPSLSVSNSNDGKILLYCHAGCSLDNICDELGITPSQLFGEKTHSKEDEQCFLYTDEIGNPLYRKKKKNSVSYFFEKYEHGRWLSGLKDVRRVLYNLPEVITAKKERRPVIIVEGEKDVETLRRYGHVATTNDTGGGKNKWKKHHSEALKGADVLLFYDYDNTGVEHRDNIIKQLEGYASSLKLVEIPGFEIVSKSGKDISDWLKEGHAEENLKKIIHDAKIIFDKVVDSDDNRRKKIIKAVSLNQLLDMDIKPPEYFLEPFITSSSLGMIYADRGLGKTFLLLSIALAIASGANFLKYKAPKPRKVIYLDGEMSLYTMKDRIVNLTNLSI